MKSTPASDIPRQKKKSHGLGCNYCRYSRPGEPLKCDVEMGRCRDSGCTGIDAS